MEAEPTVFIIDDDPAVRQALTVLVRSMHLQAEAYESAQQFLDAFDATRPGCLLLDVRMPGISGLELLEQLSRDEVRLPAIVMSAYGDVPMVVRAMKAGALEFPGKTLPRPAALGGHPRGPASGTPPIASTWSCAPKCSTACNVSPPASTRSCGC